MIEQYKKTMIPTQMVILTICAVLYFYYAVPPLGVFWFFLIMQLGAVAGAAWAVRRERKTQMHDLPLKR